MARRSTVRTIVLAALGLVLAGWLGYAAHRLAGDSVGLTTAAVRAGETLAPIDTGVPAAETSSPPASVTDVSGAGAVDTALTDTGAVPPASAGGADSAPDEASGRPRARLAAGRAVFTGTCASCHTLADARASGTVGPNLDRLAPSRAQVAAQVRSGGGGMPAFAGTLSAQQIADVALYVAHTTGGAPAPSSPAPAEPSSPAPPPASPSPVSPVTTDDDGSGDDRGGDDSSGRGSDDDSSGSGSDDDSGRGRGRGGDDRDD
jgi:mono/diheme cytochrome c family protein